MIIIFVDWTPIEKKDEIFSGNHIRRYYAWIMLNKMIPRVISFRKKNGNINFRAILKVIKKDSIIWVEYSCGGIAHIFVLFASILFSKRILLNVHDFYVQQKYVDKEIPYLRRMQNHIIERLLLTFADTIILASPGLLNYFRPKKNQKILIMPPGVGEDELFFTPLNKKNGKNVALYFGSMQRKGAIPKIMELFFELKNWELHLVGLKEGENINEKENVKYLGSMSHDKLNAVLSYADVILIPIPKNDYLDNAMHMKIGYVLKACRPVIATRLKGISEYVSRLHLEENVIFIDDWNLENLKEALRKSQSMTIDSKRTIEMLRSIAWEPRFRKAVGIALGIDGGDREKVEWI